MNKKILIAVIPVVLVAVLFIAFKFNTPEKNSSSSVTPSNSNASIATESGPSTIASQWQWVEANESTANNKKVNEVGVVKGDDLPFNQKSVHDALYAVKIDENGDVILDNDALISLDEALERIYNQLDAESMLKLQDLIRDALPGKVGEQTAELVSDYNDFLKAKEQFSLLNENTAYNDGVQSAASIERDQSLYSELQSLREVHLGSDVTQDLFREHDANAEYMFDSMALNLDDSLSPEDRERRRQEIEDRFRDVVPLPEEQGSPEGSDQG